MKKSQTRNYYTEEQKREALASVARYREEHPKVSEAVACKKLGLNPNYMPRWKKLLKSSRRVQARPSNPEVRELPSRAAQARIERKMTMLQGSPEQIARVLNELGNDVT